MKYKIFGSSCKLEPAEEINIRHQTDYITS